MKKLLQKKTVLASLMALPMAFALQAANMPPVNPYLADSNNSLPHNSPAQQTNVFEAGPTSGSRQLDRFTDITFVASGPFQFGQPTSSVYPDGRRVMWGSGGDRIVKVDQDSHAVLASYALPGRTFLNAGIGMEAIHKLDTLEPEEALQWLIGNIFPYMTDLSGAYTLIDRDNRFFVGRSDKVSPEDPNTEYRSSITIYSDEVKGEPNSSIVIDKAASLPREVKGSIVGINMTYDGWVLVATDDGYLTAMTRNLRRMQTFNLASMVKGKDKVSVRNSIAVDKDGGIYVATENHMIKVNWNGNRFVSHKRSGAWVAEYPNGTGAGTGATPSLMGFGDEDQLVVITDGDEKMNVALFWRDDIPRGWKTPEGTTDPRYAGFLETTMADPSVGRTQTEQSTVVHGNGVLVVNNTPPTMPSWFPSEIPNAESIVIGWLGHHDVYKPYGVEKFEWDSEARQFTRAWTNMDVSSLNGVPVMSVGSNMAYTVGARDGQFTMEAIDWTSGETARTWTLGGSRFNSLYSGMLIDEHGRLHYTGLWGKVRLEID